MNVTNKKFDQDILDLIGSPNVWTPLIENKWLKELTGMSAVEIYIRYPPMKKPSHIKSKGKNYGG